MKDFCLHIRKLRNETSLIITIFVVFTNQASAQKGDNEEISKEEYEVINNVIKPGKNEESFIYGTTNYDKTIAVYFQSNMLDAIVKKVGIPVSISDEELRAMLTSTVLYEIRSKIYQSKPLALDAELLNNGIVLTNSFDKKSDLEKNVKRITEPIILGDIAIFRIIGYLESSVHILKKEKGRWNIKFTFNDWLILE